METFRFNSEKWDANHHPWNGLNSGFLLTHARQIRTKRSTHSTSPAEISKYIKIYCLYVKDLKITCIFYSICIKAYLIKKTKTIKIFIVGY